MCRLGRRDPCVWKLTGTLSLSANNYTTVALVNTYIIAENTAGFTTPRPLWKFTIGGAFTTAAASNVVFVASFGGAAITDRLVIKALSALVEWEVTGAIALGAGSEVTGNMESGGAISLGAGATSIGALSSAGGGAITLGAGASAPGRLPANLNSVFLAPGNYESTTAIALTGTVFLDNPDGVVRPEWNFRIEYGAFAASAGSHVDFVGTAGALAVVTWNVDGAITVGADSHVIGTMRSRYGTITLGAGASSGSLTTGGGAISLGVGTSCTDIAGTPSTCPA
jgi:hypothetical protein